MGRERMNPAIFGHVQNEPSHTRHHRSSRKEFYWICIDQSKNSRELNNGFSCWWILFFAFFDSLHRSLIMKRWCQNHQQMRSERRTPHHWIRNEIPKIKLNWQVFYLRIKITSKILQMELKRLEIFISFHFIIFNEFFFWLRAPCGVVRYQTFQTSHGMQRIFFSDFEWRSAMIQ